MLAICVSASKRDPQIMCEGKDVDRDRARRSTDRYIEQLELFGAPCWIETSFFDGRLRYMAGNFEPVSEPARTVAAIVEALKARGYELSGHEDSDQVRGAYSDTFKKPPVAATLWVNLNDPRDPIISLNLRDETEIKRDEDEKSARNASSL
jgi:hypothetical protein